MSLALLAPLGLAALAALALPLLIHLVRRLELQTTPFAALRWISERVRPQRRLRFERLWLLLLRLVLLAALALLLARPVWNGDAQPARSWGVVAPGVALGDARAAVGAGEAEWHWLAPGFPRTDEAPPSSTVAVASLLRELDAELPSAAKLAVVVPEQLGGLDGERPRLSRAVDWRSVPARAPEAASWSNAAPIRLAVRYAPESADSLRYLRAAVAAWNQREAGRYAFDAQPAEVPLAETTTWLVWLAPPAPALTQWLDRGGTALVAGRADAGGEPLWRDASGRVLARQSSDGAGRTIALAGALTPADLPPLLDADFPDRLRAAFAGAPPAPDRAPAAVAAPRVDERIAASAAQSPANARPLDAWLAWLIAGLFLLERIVAMRIGGPAAEGPRARAAKDAGGTRAQESPT
ncbi:BatA domain-containing protein [Dokdonella sp.]|uniref:BatA domain-containing protein n=1 Tax=Dokdonella sp. TaxID=2291710 RepID=UPI001B079A74|nr:BatA domain-containing protein [Dokdonella sp.]MBO9662023.1 BatA domain-containing protein [Dokdonella sp.]